MEPMDFCIKDLGIPVLIITDMDIKRGNEDEDNEIIQYPQISCLTSKETTNETIVELFGNSALSLIPEHIELGNLYVAYQGKVNGYYATSFEEALILTNYNNEIVNEEDDSKIPQLPSYISNGLDWIEEQLKVGGMK